MGPKAWLSVAGFSLAILCGELFFGIGLWFSPGWANGWPFGITINTVWSTGMSVLFFLLTMTMAAGLGAVFVAVCSLFDFGRRRGRTIYLVWLVCSCILLLIATMGFFRQVYLETLEM